MASDTPTHRGGARERQNAHAAVRRLRDRLIADRDAGQVTTLHALGWFSVPFELAPLVDAELCEALCDLIRDRRSSGSGASLVAVYLCPSTDEDRNVSVELPDSAASLEEWSVGAAWSDWLIADSDASFAMAAFGVPNFNVFFGDDATLQSLLGMSIAESLSAFEEFARTCDYESDASLHQEEVRIAHLLQQ